MLPSTNVARTQVRVSGFGHLNFKNTGYADMDPDFKYTQLFEIYLFQAQIQK